MWDGGANKKTTKNIFEFVLCGLFLGLYKVFGITNKCVFHEPNRENILSVPSTFTYIRYHI